MTRPGFPGGGEFPSLGAVGRLLVPPTVANLRNNKAEKSSAMSRRLGKMTRGDLDDRY